MKISVFLLFFFFNLGILLGQVKIPNVCVTPPAPYQKGGYFEFIVQLDGFTQYTDQVCVGNDLVTVGLINASVTTDKKHRYLLDVTDDIFIPKPDELSMQDLFTISKADAGEYWVMQIEEEKGSYFLSCRALTIESPPTPPALGGLLASVEGNGNLQVTNSERPDKGQDFALFLEPGTTLLDIQSDPNWMITSLNGNDRSHCFSSMYQGECRLKSELSSPVCSPFIFVDVDQLVWEKPEVGVDWEILVYQVMEVRPDGSEVQLVETTNSQVFLTQLKGDRSKRIRLKVILKNKKDLSTQSIQSNVLTIEPLQSIYFPNVFTPNQDGSNDTWGPISSERPISLKLVVFDRSGQIVFETTDWEKSQWDGQISGRHATAGVYVYQFDYQLVTGQPKKVQGSILLLR